MRSGQTSPVHAYLEKDSEPAFSVEDKVSYRPARAE